MNVPRSTEERKAEMTLGSAALTGRATTTVAAHSAPATIQPTLATILRVETPSGSMGRVLVEMFGQ